ncbi:MAG: hypothetical protein WCG27_07145, partial [Pseudomonadota bacterium]
HPGTLLALFLNTHQVTWAKFNLLVDTLIKDSPIKLEMVKKFKLGEDCPTISSFPEGDYLKGVLLKVKE